MLCKKIYMAKDEFIALKLAMYGLWEDLDSISYHFSSLRGVLIPEVYRELTYNLSRNDRILFLEWMAENSVPYIVRC